MTYENLLKSVEENVQERERELRERARKATEEIAAEARNQAAVIGQSCLADAERVVAVERNKQRYLTKAKNKDRLIRIRETIYEQAFREAEERLKGVRKDPAYPKIFAHLLKEAADALGAQKIRIHINRQDEDLCRKTAQELNLTCEIIADLHSAGGVVASTPDETVKISNTVESRLGRAREGRKLEIYTVLSGG